MNTNAVDNQLITFSLNGVEQTIETNPKRSVLSVLRTDFGLSSLKPGCSPQGVCGCCVALINGKPRITCTLPAKTLAGKSIQTLESLSEREAQIYSEAFAGFGGTQCGYCTPGIVSQTHALLEKNPDPDDTAIKKALQMHICRCTGWVKIHDSIKAAAAMRRNELSIPLPKKEGVGGSWQKNSVYSAVLGRRPYIDDLDQPKVLHGALVWTPHPRCRINGIDVAEANEMPGVHRICTAKDLPGDRKVGLIFRDWPVLIDEGEETNCVADILAVVVADSREQARAAAEAVHVDAEKLKPLTNVLEAVKDPANIIATSTVVKGDVDAALANCTHTVSDQYTTQVIDQAFLEPEAALAIPDEDGGITVFSCGQGVFDDQKQLCELFDLPPEKMRVVLVPTGGAFGAKEDLNVQPHAILAARVTGQPVKIALDMTESTRFHPKRHAFHMTYTVGCDADGQLVALKADLVGDTGGYASVGDKVLERGAGHAAGPYHVHNVGVVAQTVKTNNPVCGAMRGFGVNQVAFALESCLEKLADAVGMDPLEFRAKNLLDPGLRFATGQIMNEGCGIRQTLEAIRPHYDRAKAEGKHVGVACAIKNTGMGNGLTEVGRVEFVVEEGGKIRLYTGFTEMGQAHDTVMAQMASQATGLPADTFVVECSTRAMVETGMTTASRATYLGGNAVIAASQMLSDGLSQVGGDLSKLLGRRFLGEWTAPPTHTPEEGATVENPVTHYAFGFATQLAIVDQDGALEEVVAAHDVGRAINRITCEGQVEGGVHMGIGYALSEELIIDDEGWPDMRYGKLGILKAKQMPRVTTILVEHEDPHGPWGVKGIGEIGLVPTAPAIAIACARHDGIWRTKLPMRETPAAKAMGVRMPKPPRPKVD